MMQTKGRLLFVDGLRGVAAMMVVAYHFWGNLPESSREATPSVFGWLLAQGNLGVDVFFVLSGFVIAHSIRHGDYSLRYVARFALRRSVRLDPPYWLTIALELALIRVSLAFFPDLGTPIPGWEAVLANAAYVYRFLGLPEVVPVFWSLTYEVQFYLVLVLVAVLVRLLHERVPRLVSLVPAVFAVSVAYSFLIWILVFRVPLVGIFLDRWYQFALGAIAWLVAIGRLRPRTLVVPLVVLSLAAVAQLGLGYRMYTTLVSCGIAGALAYAGRCDRMDWLSGPVFQFSGRISYSLYLLHVVVGWRAMSLLKQLLGPEISPIAGYGILLVGVGASIVSAYAMYRLVEKPSITLARRVRLPTRDTSQAREDQSPALATPS